MNWCLRLLRFVHIILRAKRKPLPDGADRGGNVNVEVNEVGSVLIGWELHLESRQW